jgi:DGQHR domain-containing protein
LRNPNNESENSGYAMGALVMGVDQEGRFEPVKVDVDQEGRRKESPLGVLHLPISTKVRSIDGQHRRYGIIVASDTIEQLKSDHCAVVIYHEPKVEKRRQMFSDMNWTVRRVPTSVNIGFESRDPWARATVRLADEHSLLKDRIEKDKSYTSKASGRWWTLAVIYDTLRRLTVAEARIKVVDYSEDMEALMEWGARFFDMLLESQPVLTDWAAKTEDIETLRRKSILFSGQTLKVIATAVREAEAAGVSWEDITKRLTSVDFAPSAAIWQRAGFVVPGKYTPAARNQELRAAARALRDVLTSGLGRLDLDMDEGAHAESNAEAEEATALAASV